MAKHAQDREDLLNDAAGLPIRIEFLILVDARQQTVFCGFRDRNAFSIYWGQDKVIQFNADGEFRRAFWQNRRVASYKRELHWLSPNSDLPRIQLTRTKFTPQESESLISEINGCLQTLEYSLVNDRHEVVGRFPQDADVLKMVKTWLSNRPPLPFATHPGVRGKK